MFKISDMLSEAQKNYLFSLQLYEEVRSGHIDNSIYMETLKSREKERYARLLGGDNDDLAFISGGGLAFRRKDLVDAIKEKYHFAGVYRIGKVCEYEFYPLYIVHLSKNQPRLFRVAFFKKGCYKKGREKSPKNEGIVQEALSDEWKQFVILLEDWMNGGDMPESNELYEFNQVQNSQLVDGRLDPEFYTKVAIEVRKLLNKYDTKKLSDIANISISKEDRNSKEKVKVLRPWNFEYPLDVSTIGLDTPTSIILQKGDIVIPRSMKAQFRAYLFNYDGKEPIYASDRDFVIKCRNISPEYLCLYLNSETALSVFNAEHYDKEGVYSFYETDLINVPVIVPTQNEQKYITDFNILTNYGIRNYDQLQKIAKYYEHLSKIPEIEEKPQDIEDILNIELAKNIKAYREDQLRSLLSDDLRELNICFKNKAYKATLILAGSILEAVLIDWLSEILGQVYFEEEWRIEDEKTGIKKRAELADYINQIDLIKYPEWMEQADKAHEIRKKRNLVHARLCLKEDVKINEDTCKTVISYLKDVLETRGVIMKE